MKRRPGQFFSRRPYVTPTPQIRNLAPQLNLPNNNRVFIDGNAYEVYYLDHVAVIEKNGLPHRISFYGPPRDIVIDGIAHRLSFGETKAVMIDGNTHYLRFGGPSRELYMGDFPFKGVFGGPPIVATINGRRHEIRLCGPPPEVKVEQDPSYELMRDMQNLRQSNTSGFPSVKKEDKGLGISDFLAKLQKTGVLDNLHQPRSVCRICPVCGIYFDNTNSSCYRNHLDEHTMNDLKEVASIHPMGKSRQRYLNAEEWAAYSKVDAIRDLNR